MNSGTLVVIPQNISYDKNDFFDNCLKKIRRIKVRGMGYTSLLQSEFYIIWGAIVFNYARVRTIAPHQIFVYNSKIPIPIPIAIRPIPNTRFPIRNAKNPRTMSKGGTPYAITFIAMSILYFPYSFFYLKKVSESLYNCFSKQGIIESDSNNYEKLVEENLFGCLNFLDDASFMTLLISTEQNSYCSPSIPLIRSKYCISPTNNLTDKFCSNLNFLSNYLFILKTYNEFILFKICVFFKNNMRGILFKNYLSRLNFFNRDTPLPIICFLVWIKFCNIGVCKLLKTYYLLLFCHPCHLLGSYTSPKLCETFFDGGGNFFHSYQKIFLIRGDF